MDWFTDFVMAVIRAATPLVFCALGVLIAEHAGVSFLGVEGIMLIGALTGILGTVYTGSAYLGILITVGVGALIGALMALLLVKLPTDQVVVGIAFNITATGLTSYIFRLIGTKAQETVPAMQPVLFGLSFFEVLAVVLTVLLWWFLFRTGPGLKLRVLGESAVSARAAGINVTRVRSIAMIIASIFPALGGAALSIGWVRVFTENITLGRGFIALAAVYFGKWNPLFTLLATIVFGIGEALAFRSQTFDISINAYYFMILPYLLTLIAVGLSGKSKGPADVGKVYIQK